MSPREEKEFGFRGAEGRLLLLRNCRVCIQVSEGGTPAEFYLQVNRFSLLPTEQPRVWVMDCHQDLDVQKKLCDCLEDHLSECTSSNTGTSRGSPVILAPFGVTSPAVTSCFLTKPLPAQPSVPSL